MDFPARPHRIPRWFLAFVALSTLLGLFAAYIVIAPRAIAYELDADALVIRATMGVWDQGRTVPRADVREVKKLALHDHGRKIMGSNAPGFCVGRFSHPVIGDVWQATDCGVQALLLDTAAGPVVISPADRDGFVAAFEGGGTGRFDAPPAPAGPEALWIIAAVALLPIPAFVWLFGRLSRPLVYTVAGGVLTVPAHFSPVKVRLAGAKVEHAPLGFALRIAGSGLPGFALGAFRARGTNLHVAATDTKDGVWVRGDRVVYVSPADVPAFLAALRAEGALLKPEA